MTLPRRSRLTAQAHFRSVFQQPVVSTDAWFKVLARRTELPHSRLGLAVSRQVDRRAVERNRIKRIVRDSFRRHYVNGRDRHPADFVVLPRRAAISISNQQLRERLSRHWARIDERIGASITCSRP
jgi:ribonuclease P protein component